MTVFSHGAFVRELRRRRKTIPTDLYADLMASLEVGLGGTPPAPGDLAWLVEARRHIGEKEIPGSKHSSVILGWIKRLGGSFTDDETPWCGTFVGYCVLRAGLDPTKHWYRARDWMSWGKSTPARVGAIAVFGRDGGGHVGFVLGESKTHYYVLGGNQSNAVNIMPIEKDRWLGFRWPASMALSTQLLPAMSGGTVSRNEA